jgi:hypothetical protein
MKIGRRDGRERPENRLTHRSKSGFGDPLSGLAFRDASVGPDLTFRMCRGYGPKAASILSIDLHAECLFQNLFSHRLASGTRALGRSLKPQSYKVSNERN